jgi:hypothetical protein
MDFEEQRHSFDLVAYSAFIKPGFQELVQVVEELQERSYRLVHLRVDKGCTVKITCSV